MQSVTGHDVGVYLVTQSVIGLLSLLVRYGVPILPGSEPTVQVLLNLSLPQLVQVLVGLAVWRMAPALARRIFAATGTGAAGG